MVISFKQSMMLILVVYVSKISSIFASDDLLPNIWLKVSDDSVEPSLPVYTKHTYLCKYQLGPSQSSVVLHTHVGQYVMIEQLPLPDWCEIRSTPSSSFDAKSNIPQSLDRLTSSSARNFMHVPSLIPSTMPLVFFYTYIYIQGVVLYNMYICNFFSSICIFFSSLDYQFVTGSKH